MHLPYLFEAGGKVIFILKKVFRRNANIYVALSVSQNVNHVGGIVNHSFILKCFTQFFSNLSRTECCGMVHEIGGHSAEKTKQISDTLLYHSASNAKIYPNFDFI